MLNPTSGTTNLHSLPDYDYQEVYNLAKIIHAEARGETFDGMVAVGAVVLNRVEDQQFPNTIEEVILQPRQFSSVNDGQFNLEPNKTALEAAYIALIGMDPTNGCLYFYNPTIATVAWSFKRKTEVVIGNHSFTK